MKLLQKRQSYFSARRRKFRAMGILLATLTFFMIFAIGCTDNPTQYNPIDATSCDLHHVEVFPESITLAVGDTISFNCIGYTQDGEQIYDQIEKQWSSNSPLLLIDEFNGFARLCAEITDDVTLTVKAYDCEGVEYSKTAMVIMAGPK